MLFLCILLGLCQVHYALAAQPTTKPSPVTATPTTTYCPRYYSTSISPSPTARVCGRPGTLSKTNVLAAYCGHNVPGLGSRGIHDDIDVQCYRACAAMPQCQSYSLDPAHSVCYIYGKTLQEQGFVQNATRYQFFWDMRGCYKCNLAAPPVQSECPSQPSPKSPPPKDFNCGGRGMPSDVSKAILVEATGGNDGQVGFDPNLCYQICADFYEPLGVCQSYLLYQPKTQNYPDCYIFNSSLADIGYRYNTSGLWRGWNLRGCFNCNLATKTAQACQPTSTPIGIGARNGGFQRTYVDKSNNKLSAYEWDLEGNYAIVQQSNGNNYLSLSANVTAYDYLSYGFSDQVGYGFNHDPDSPNRFYNYTFDVAIPYHYNSLPKTESTGCYLQYPGPNDFSQIFATDKRFQGNTLKRFGPYTLDGSDQYANVANLGFYVTCYLLNNTAYFANATFYVDNLRITQYGKDFGEP